jgi:two-component system cell cycle sensor histidine kinase/response regulator CckA
VSLKERVNILVVDDRPDGLLTIEAVLQSPDLNLVKCSSGKEALQQLQKDDFAVILLDVQMPVMDGFQTAAKIKEIPRAHNVPIVFITAIHKDPFYIYQGYHMGAVDYIFKPFDPAILRSKVGVFVEMFRQQQQIRRQALEIQQKEQELAQAQKLEAVGRLAGGVAHDFNNLITGVLGLSHDVESTLHPGDARKDDMQEIIKASNRALALTKQLLAFGRRQISSPRILDINSIILDMSKMLQRLITEDIQLTTELSPALRTVMMDHGQVEQILMNIVLNARDAMPKGGAITIRTKNEDVHASQESNGNGHKAGDSNCPPTGAYAIIEIIDTGVGMDTTTLNHIFEPYYTTKDKDKGTGLGLATVYGVIMQCGGHITVQSKLGEGTRFKIYLPFVAGIATEENISVSCENERGGQETILVVEDEGIVRQVATRMLRKRGYTVLEAPNADGALEIVSHYREPIHLLITDVVMPGMNGRELAEKLLTQRPDLAVLYMSGYSEDIVMHRGILEPGLAFIEKSFTGPMLLQKVRDVLDEHQKAERKGVVALPGGYA